MAEVKKVIPAAIIPPSTYDIVGLTEEQFQAIKYVVGQAGSSSVSHIIDNNDFYKLYLDLIDDTGDGF